MMTMRMATSGNDVGLLTPSTIFLDAGNQARLELEDAVKIVLETDGRLVIVRCPTCRCSCVIICLHGRPSLACNHEKYVLASQTEYQVPGMKHSLLLPVAEALKILPVLRRDSPHGNEIADDVADDIGV